MELFKRLLFLSIFPYSLASQYSSSWNRPVIYYCTSNTSQNSEINCDFIEISDSKFRFGDLSSNVINLREEDVKEGKSLVLKCNSSYPIRWAPQRPSPFVTLVSNKESNRYYHNPLPTENNAMEYNQEIVIPLSLDFSRVFKCESYQSSPRRSEVFINLQNLSNVDFNFHTQFFQLDGDPGKNSTLIFPCQMNQIHDRLILLMKWRMTQGSGVRTGLTTLETKREEYDPRIGIKIRGRPDYHSIYKCVSPNISSVLFPQSPRRKIPAQFKYTHEYDFLPGLFCQCQVGGFDGLDIFVGKCNSIAECELKFKKNLPLVSVKFEKTADRKNLTGQFQRVTSFSPVKPKASHGFVECHGLFGMETHSHGRLYVSESDFLFTGLDGNKYIVSSGFPMFTVISMRNNYYEPLRENHYYVFDCQISTFVLLPNVQFILEYSGGKREIGRIHHKSCSGRISYTRSDTVHAATPGQISYTTCDRLSNNTLYCSDFYQIIVKPGEAVENAEIGSMHRDNEKATLTVELQVRLSKNLTKITCFAPWYNTTEWAKSEIYINRTTNTARLVTTESGETGEIEVRKNPTIHYCYSKFNQPALPSDCNFQEISNSQFQFGDLYNSTIHFTNLTQRHAVSLYLRCTAPYPVRWLANKPLGAIRRISSYETNRYHHSPHNKEGTQLYYQDIYITLRFQFSVILRCESYEDTELASDLFIKIFNWRAMELPFLDTGSRYFLVGKESDEFFIIPCLSTDVRKRLILTKRSALPTELQTTTTDCIKCICFASSGCALDFPCESSDVCGMNNSAYWRMAEAVGSKWDSDCMSEITCANSRIINATNELDPKVGDCNKDGVLSCEDYARAYFFGQDECGREATALEQRFLNRFSECMGKDPGQSFEVVVTRKEDYDPRIGLRMEGKPDFELGYECHASLRDTQLLYPVDPRQKVPASIGLDEVQGKGSSVYCEARGSFESMDLIIGMCSSWIDCELQFAPMAPASGVLDGTDYGEFEKVGLRYQKINVANSERVSRSYNHGFILCSRFYDVRIGGDLRMSVFIREISYMFTGLDNNSYIISNGFPENSIIRLENTQESPQKPNQTYTFVCTVSTFVLLPNIQFLVDYSDDGKTSQLIRMGGEYFGAKIKKENPNPERASVSWNLEITLRENMSKISCFAPWVNSGDWARSEITLEFLTESTFIRKDGSDYWTIISLATSVFVVIIIAIVILWVKFGPQETGRNLTQEEIDEFLYGDSNGVSDSKVDVIKAVELSKIPFEPQKIIPIEDLEIENVVLGEGQFGIVRRGIFTNKEVAVKSCKSNVDIENFKGFLEEVKTMGYIGENQNIIGFFGAVVAKIGERECFAVTELSILGNLNNYLRRYARSRCFALSPDDDCNSSNLSLSLGSDQQILLNKSILLSFCKQIASGMEFVSSKQVIHGDLATRNILVFEGNVVKIADFGLSRKLCNFSNYVKKQKTPMPWRWMALESLLHSEFSFQSDVWSFGVTMWEIFSLAEVPYSAITWSDTFLNSLTSGERLSKPHLASSEVFDLMLKCWDVKPQNRPTFDGCKAFLTALENTQIDFVEYC